MCRYRRQGSEKESIISLTLQRKLLCNLFPCYLTSIWNCSASQEKLGQGLQVTIVTLKFQCVVDSLQSEVLTELSLLCSQRQRDNSRVQAICLFSYTYISKPKVDCFIPLPKNNTDSLEVPIGDHGPPQVSYKCRETIYTINA